MANKLKTVFVPSTNVLTAKIDVVRKTKEGEQGSLSAVLNFESKRVEIDLTSYKRMSIENVRMLGEALVALAQEASDALEAL